MTKEGLVLIVEDDDTCRSALENLLGETYEVMEAVNGEEAVDLIRRNEDRLSIIILDLYMPVMDGYAVLETLSSHKDWSEIPVIVTTSENSEESDLRLIDLGACNIIHKPINPEIVKKQVVNMVEQFQQKRQFVKEYMLQRTLFNRTTNTFMCTYHIDNGRIDMGDNYEKFVEKEFVEVFTSYPFCIDNYVLPKDLKTVRKFFDLTTEKKAYDEIEVRIRIDVMHYEWFKISVMLNYTPLGELDNAVFLFANIEQEIEAKDKLTFMAMNDILTHIPNMRTFSDDVTAMIREYPKEEFLMVTMDIYEFRLVNKLFSYSEGDNVLKYFATKIQELIESYSKGVYCRMASDIFYACFSKEEDFEFFTKTLMECMHNYPIKFELKLCFGVYEIADRDEEVESMIEHSSFARLEVKKNLLQNIQFYDAKLREKEYFEGFVVSEMEYALKHGEFEVFLQPKCNLITNEIIGSEALVRWNNPQKGYLSPGIFIPIFEQNGFVKELDYYVYEVTCKTIRRWLDDGITPLPVSVNISRYDLYDANLLTRILSIADEYDIPHDLIEIEITESAFVAESDLLPTFTRRVREFGFRVLIDDFGSGYSSLNVLKNILVDILKIDIKFLPVSESETKAPIILAAVIDMAKKLGLGIVAEGVETKEQLDLLASLQCEDVQGYYYFRPMPIVEYEKIMIERSMKKHE